MGASWPVRSRMAAVCALLLLAPVAGKPVVINLGPLMDDQLLMEDLSSALEAKHWPALIEGQQEDLLQGLLQDFGKGLLGGPAAGGFGPGSSVNFQTEVKDGHFRLRASLPGYSMHRSSDGEEPLDVQVAGRTLVVQGSKSNGNMMTSFQRSFRLPWDPDKDHVSVTYSAQDGSLLVDVPRGASSSASDAADSDSGAAAALPGEFLEPLSILAGPQMTLSFSDMDAKLAPRRRPLRGLPIVMGLRPTVRDPFEQLWNGLLADASGMHDVAVPEADPDRKHSMHSKSQPVQPKIRWWSSPRNPRRPSGASPLARSQELDTSISSALKGWRWARSEAPTSSFSTRAKARRAPRGWSCPSPCARRTAGRRTWAPKSTCSAARRRTR
ncbi:unnamed protein product [Effrenium voratum]|uniref:SHSP domain-containing protein n=1 Tax=Effrenium voratum TaxID=2562239 RepID=A0AA36HXQ6_9DINO|nr:unnamed protein product [Effrenium voratum]